MTPIKQRLLILGLIGLGVLIVGFFGIRAFHAFRRFDGHRPPPFPPSGAEPVETDVSLIRDWMTIGYISHTYRVPPKFLYEALNIKPNGNEEKSLKDLNDEYFPDQPALVVELVKAAIQATMTPPVAPSAPTTISPVTP